MNRRTFFRSTGAVGAISGLAGCLGVLGELGESGAESTVLGPPKQDLSAASHPSYGDEMQAFTVPDPITCKSVSVAEFEGDQLFPWCDSV
ncbi:twin-arginine translocation signal domain-containing protein [Natrinema sp. HArc-T2]|uniref:twin-arginine translocation signal domain-containing protein n=1 Tax=Natrinema sp. HArc-T2 TaxID=3242701 RepID=UPI00359CE180